MFSFEYLNYFELIKTYSDYFGTSNLSVFIYEDFLNNNKAFINNFTEKFKFNINVNYIVFSKYNEKLKVHLATFYRFSNYFKKKGVQPKICVINLPWLFKWLNKTSSIKINKYKIWGKYLDNNEILGTELINYIENYYKESNKKLIKDYNLNAITKYKYPI